MDGEGDCRLNLHLRKEGPAFASNAQFSKRGPGADKELRVGLSAGRWHVSVECATTVEAESVVERVDKNDSKYIRYGGDLSVLNGVAYSIGWSIADP